jgi:hypothetical protein
MANPAAEASMTPNGELSTLTQPWESNRSGNSKGAFAIGAVTSTVGRRTARCEL